ncbi:MAG TPA: ATP-binding protein [Cellvibrio sp.]|nr:ATP-binding protein [Cellvibrio sp.]
MRKLSFSNSLLGKKFPSIRGRLFLASLMLMPVFLGVTGVFLDRAFQTNLIEAEKVRLRSHIYLLFSAAELPQRAPKKNEKIKLQMPPTLIDTEFERIDSGLYAYIYNDKKELIWNSNSASLQTPPDYDKISPRFKTGQMAETNIELNDSNSFVAHFDVIWEDSKSREYPFRFVVVHNSDDFLAQKIAYRSQLWRWLGAVCVLLLLVQTTILRWGLRPLKRLAVALKAMQSGDTRNIQGLHPDELQDIVDNLNQVLEREQALRQRYRNSLSDLAHSLKTPLAVIQAKLSQPSADEELQQLTAEQVARMNQVVSYQLQRAVSSQQQGLHQRAAVEPVVQRLLSALQKVYADKQINSDWECAANCIFAGDEQDLMELLGNIIENAFKYGNTKVKVRSFVSPNKQLLFTIEDDGPGIPQQQQARILERGHRLDSNQPGQGIGLAVAADIIHSYGGQLHIQHSDLGGAQFKIQLPLGMQAAA